ncbi:uncharacterized protein J8A68_003466 [[Candida] subhashii]|uniref:Serine/threonine-protein phosphatase n=1 Tax=[Candida] subhashii TaxID=561895 RepID=A0A8J5QH54_9ASCO|nr:uncharacterized protein J8A68_003466 [[Candida] subhashii]KAG7662997.1 hypothetical protein J8A68_003466 [[Candida] subhashii]
MGNNPSKDVDPLPRSSTSTSNKSTGSSTDLLEPEEKPSPALSQSTTSTTTTTLRVMNNESISTTKTIYTSTSPAIDIGSKKNIYKYNQRVVNNNTTTPAPATAAGAAAVSRKTKKSHSSDEYDVDLTIAISMAKLLKNPTAPPSSTTLVGAAVANQDAGYGSSLDSQSTQSPVFTTLGTKDEQDSLSSVNSNGSNISNKFYYNKEEIVNKVNVSVNKLDVIAEIDNKPKLLSKENLKKHNKSFTTTASRQLTKNLSVSSSSLSNSPPIIPTTKKDNLVDLDNIIDRLVEIGINKKNQHKKKDKLPLSEQEIKYILGKSRSIFLDQPSLLRLSPPVKIVGDIHGQFHDLIRIFNCCGYPPYTNYLFLGDYVDRGYKSLETILLLLCYKIKYPENFFMLRGNHESANITKIYGFYDECKRRLINRKLWKNFIDVFNALPIAATINDKIFCVHGGLSPQLNQLSQIESIKRPTDVPDAGLLTDLLWSDPDPSVKSFSSSNWPPNDRGVSYCFGRKHVDHFCNTFKWDLIVRGHMVVEDGYEFFNKRKLVTLFSAPNYCGEFNNFGAIMNVDHNLYCSFELIKPMK